MKNITYLIILLVALTAGIASCKKSTDYLATDSTPTGGYLPVSTNALIDVANNTTIGTTATSTKYAPGAEVKTELQFFSVDPIKEINLYATVGTGSRNKMNTYPYAKAYSPIKKLDTLLVPYSVPAGTASGTTIKLDYEILNANTKSVVRTASFRTL